MLPVASRSAAPVGPGLGPARRATNGDGPMQDGRRRPVRGPLVVLGLVTALVGLGLSGLRAAPVAQASAPLSAARPAAALPAAALPAAALPAAARPAASAGLPTTPRAGWPQIADGEVAGADRVGNTLVWGGTFTQIRLPDGTLVRQPYLVAFDIDTGALVTGFRPQLNSDVDDVEAGDQPGTLFISGAFTQLNGDRVDRVAKLDLNGARVTSFTAGANGFVRTMTRTGDRLFIGGDFSAVNGQPRARLAELSAASGALSSRFTVGVTGSRAEGYRSDGYHWPGYGPIVRTIRVTPDGKKLVVMHRGDKVGGQTRWGAAVIDISGASAAVTPWQTHLWDATPFQGKPDFVGIVDGALSPDGTMFVVTSVLGNFPPLHDTAIAFPVAGGSDVQPLWVTQMFDSVYGVAIDDTSVYLGGHFCWTESQQSTPSPLYWPGKSGNQFSCYLQSGSVFQPQTTYRYHLAAVDRSTGRAVAWDAPSNNSFTGVTFIRSIDRGLLVGHDGSRISNVLVGRGGFLDRGVRSEPSEKAPPAAILQNPPAGSTVSVGTASGYATDDYRVARVQVRLQDVATGKYVQPDGSLNSTVHGYEAAVGNESDNGHRRPWVVTGLPSPVGAVVIEARAIDFAGRGSAWRGYQVTGLPDRTPPTVTLGSPADGAQVRGPATVSGSAADDRGLAGVGVAVQDAPTGRYLQADGFLATTPYAFPARVSGGGAGITASWSVSLPGATIRHARLTAVAVDGAGNRSAPSAVTVSLAAGWETLGSGANAVAAAADGSLLMVRTDGTIASRRSDGSWATITAAGSGWGDRLAAASGNSFAALRGADHVPYLWTGKGWSRLSAPGSGVIAMGADGTVGFQDSSAGHQWVWIRINGVNHRATDTMRWLSIAAVNNYWKVGIDGYLYRGRPDHWIRSSTFTAVSVSASADGAVAAVATDGTVWRWQQDQLWNKAPALPTKAKQLSTGPGGVLEVLGSDGAIYQSIG